MKASTKGLLMAQLNLKEINSARQKVGMTVETMALKKAQRMASKKESVWRSVRAQP